MGHMLSTNENTTTAQQSKKRVQLKHVLLDVDFYDKPKIRALSFKHKKISAGWLSHCYMQMSRASDAVVDRDCLEALAVEWGIPNFDEVLQYCIANKLIHQSGSGYSNTRVEEDQEACAEKREESLKRAARFRDRQRSVTNALRTRTPDTDTVTDTVTVVSSKEGGAGETTADPFEIPQASDFADSRAASALERWGEYTTKTHKKPWGQIQADALMMGYQGRVSDLIRDINGSMAAGWRTVRDCSQAKPNAPNSPKETSFERNMRILRES